MDEIAKALESLNGTSIADALERMAEFYDETKSEITSFSEKEGVKCPPGCGICCSRFLPDITKYESLFLSAFIAFSEKKEEIMGRLGSAKGQKNGPCPLYDESKAYHCMCYEARPLICRLFAATCFAGKSGERKFSHCHLNAAFKGPDSIDESAPMMGNYGQKMLALQGEDSVTEFLPERLLKDIALIEYYIGLKEK